MCSEDMSVAAYLSTRLKELGTDQVFGVPGDCARSALARVGRTCCMPDARALTLLPRTRIPPQTCWASPTS